MDMFCVNSDHIDIDETVADGAAVRQRGSLYAFPSGVANTNLHLWPHGQMIDPSHTLVQDPSHFPKTWNNSSEICSQSQKSQNNTNDSGFVSGPCNSKDHSQVDLTAELSDQCANMKINSLDSDNIGYPQSPVSSDFSQVQSPPQMKLGPITLEDLVQSDEDGDMPLHLAVLQGFIEVVFSLVRIFPEPWFLDLPNNRLQTPLHLAVLTNQAPLVRRLVVGGASVLSRDRLGNTPLHMACRDGYVDCVKALCIPVSEEERQCALLSHDAPPQPLPQDLEQRNYEGQMPLHLAVMGGHMQVVKILCYFGADVNAAEAKYGRTALHYAVERRWPAVLHFLVNECGAQIEAETYCGYSAYQLASVAAPVLAALLAQMGADPRPFPGETSVSSESEDSDVDCEIAACRSTTEQVLKSSPGAFYLRGQTGVHLID